MGPNSDPLGDGMRPQSAAPIGIAFCLRYIDLWAMDSSIVFLILRVAFMALHVASRSVLDVDQPAAAGLLCAARHRAIYRIE